MFSEQNAQNKCSVHGLWCWVGKVHRCPKHETLLQCITLYGIVWHGIVVYGVSFYCMYGIAWYCMALYGIIIWHGMVVYGVVYSVAL